MEGKTKKGAGRKGRSRDSGKLEIWQQRLADSDKYCDS